METIELADGGILLYDDAFLPPDLAGRYFAELRHARRHGRDDAAVLEARSPEDHGGRGERINLTFRHIGEAWP